ncbi:MAG: MBL fold metallo-hydrolase [Muribaculaceae bacterium]|nr:MBL fold metallo-hydrolase [Muribaculaceae bacterium]
MNITIHRGTNTAAGCFTEIATKKTRILIDLGANRPGAEHDAFTREDVENLTQGVNAIFYSHYHSDHLGLFVHVPEKTAQYMGPDAIKLMKIKSEYIGKSDAAKKLDTFKPYDSGTTIKVGDIKITPQLVSHSAFDSHFLIIEAGGKRILYAGDLRGTGYPSSLLYNADPRKNKLKRLMQYLPIDVLIAEGAMATHDSEKAITENELQQKARQIMSKNKHIFVQCSSTDVDRLASFYNANKAIENRPIVCDSYQKHILKHFADSAGHYSQMYKIGKSYIYNPEDMSHKLHNWMRDKGCCMFVRPSMTPLIEYIIEKLGRENTVLIYSMWPGHYNGKVAGVYNPRYARFRKLFGRVIDLNTCGSDDDETLRQLRAAFDPRDAIVCINKVPSTSLISLDMQDNLRVGVIPSHSAPSYIKIID